jgi:hypothetical protein
MNNLIERAIDPNRSGEPRRMLHVQCDGQWDPAFAALLTGEKISPKHR